MCQTNASDEDKAWPEFRTKWYRFAEKYSAKTTQRFVHGYMDLCNGFYELV